MVRIREMENKKDFEDVADAHYMMGYKLEKYTDNEFTFKKTKTSKLILHLAIILLCWTIGFIILKKLLYIGYLNGVYTIHGYYGYMEISLFILLIILIIINWKPISRAYNGEKITIKLKNLKNEKP